MNDTVTTSHDLGINTPAEETTKYLHLVHDNRGERFSHLGLSVQLDLVEAFLLACIDPAGWLEEAYIKQDLQDIDRRYLLKREPIPESEFIRARKQAFCNFFCTTIDIHLSGQGIGLPFKLPPINNFLTSEKEPTHENFTTTRGQT